MNIYITYIICIVLAVILYYVYNKTKTNKVDENFDIYYDKNINKTKRTQNFAELDFIKEKYNEDYDELANIVDEFRCECEFNDKKLNVTESTVQKYDMKYINEILTLMNAKIKNYDKSGGINQPQTLDHPYEKHLKNLGVDLPYLYHKAAEKSPIYLIKIFHAIQYETTKEILYAYNIAVKKKNSSIYANIIIFFLEDKFTENKTIYKIVINGYLRNQITRNNRVRLSPVADIKEIVNSFSKWQKKHVKFVLTNY